MVVRPVRDVDKWRSNANYSDYAAVNAIKASGRDPYLHSTNSRGQPQITTNPAKVQAFWRGGNQTAGTPTMYTNPNAGRPSPQISSGGGSSRGGGGGGGGGGGVAPLNVDWLTQLLARARPTDATATNLDLPDFQGQFDPSYYNTMRGSWNSALDQSRQVGNEATSNLMNFLSTNYSNGFNNPNASYATQATAPGMDQQAMARMLQSQGVDPSINAANVQGAAAADQGFQNLFRTLGVNEDRNQQNRLGNAQIANQDVQNRINAIGLQGTTGIGLQEGQARSAYDQAMQERNWQTAQQEAMQNWQRQNQVADTNAQNRNSYTNAQLQALLGLLPQLSAGGQMPDLNVLLGGAA